MSTATERPRSAGEWVQFAVALLLVAVMFYPTVWMVLSAFKNNREIFRTPFALPQVWRWENFAEAWKLGNLGTLYLNSLFVTAVAVTLCVGCATAAAFAFARLEFPGRRLALPRHAARPVAAAADRRHPALHPASRHGPAEHALGADPAGSRLVALAHRLPDAVLFQHLRPDMEEAAKIDGANTFQIFWNVSVPMVWPAVLTMIVLNTINIWNELLFALLFIVDEDKRTLPVGLIRFYGYHNTDYSLVFAALSITTIPILLLYFFLQRHVIAGLTATSMD